MPATAWDLFCSAWFSVISHWLRARSSFGRRSCSLSGWQCLVLLLCSARFIFSVCPSQPSAFLWPAMSLALRSRGLIRQDVSIEDCFARALGRYRLAAPSEGSAHDGGGYLCPGLARTLCFDLALQALLKLSKFVSDRLGGHLLVPHEDAIAL